MRSKKARLRTAACLAGFARITICVFMIVAMSSCIDASYWLNQKSPLPRCFAMDSRVKTWKHPRIYYALIGDEVTADVWDGLLHHAHVKGRIVKTEPYDGGALVIYMNGVYDRYVFRDESTPNEDTMYMAPKK